MIDIALYQPDIAGNTGTTLRTAACLGFGVHVIEPAGFDLSDRSLKRAGMDYLEMAALTRHDDWTTFRDWSDHRARRIVLLTTKSNADYRGFEFQPGDLLLFGRESSGVPDHVHDSVDERLTIPMQPGARSLNLAVSVGIVAAHAIASIQRKAL